MYAKTSYKLELQNEAKLQGRGREGTAGRDAAALPPGT